MCMRMKSWMLERVSGGPFYSLNGLFPSSLNMETCSIAFEWIRANHQPKCTWTGARSGSAELGVRPAPQHRLWPPSFAGWLVGWSSLVYTIHTKFHAHAHLDEGLWLVSPSDPIFDLATNEEQVCLRLFPDPKLHISLFRGRWKRRQHFTLVRNSKSKKRDLREQTEELSYVWFWKFIKPKYLSKGD